MNLIVYKMLLQIKTEEVFIYRDFTFMRNVQIGKKEGVLWICIEYFSAVPDELVDS
ncbi:hypothetical protein SAMN02744037_00152 [Tepidibacter formicigenes DSM 15518]|jgi:hypothetical protein|uniref:Uncharacterized protein n=1 Tax=Tepidibacter formicigenes DSM 15518 TaxID=1123349 RepID=A0A1M6JNL0_9FIRM|nr:hypothetical protein SAMN02744037_00152 [Tepidibacter formicigenes DSM 15518]